MAGLGSWGTYEDGRADKIQGQLDSLKASYSIAAQQAKDDAAATEAKDLASLKSQSSQALQQATYARNQAQLATATYNQKLAQLASTNPTDLPHRCASIPIAPELIP